MNFSIDKAMSQSEDLKEEINEECSLRRIIFFSISISTIATLTAIIAVPTLYNYMQYIQSSLQGEIDYCQSNAKILLMEFIEVLPFIERVFNQNLANIDSEMCCCEECERIYTRT